MAHRRTLGGPPCLVSSVALYAQTWFHLEVHSATSCERKKKSVFFSLSPSTHGQSKKNRGAFEVRWTRNSSCAECCQETAQVVRQEVTTVSHSAEPSIHSGRLVDPLFAGEVSWHRGPTLSRMPVSIWLFPRWADCNDLRPRRGRDI